MYYNPYWYIYRLTGITLIEYPGEWCYNHGRTAVYWQGGTANSHRLWFYEATMSLAAGRQDTLVKALTLHHIILRLKAELDQHLLQDGLSTLGVASTLASNPTVFEPLFTAIEDVELTSCSG